VSPAVYADTNRHVAVARFFGHRLDVLGLANVAGVQSQAVHAGLERGEGHLVLVMDVGDDRNRRARHDLRQTFGGFDLVASAAHDIAARGGERVNLLQRAFDVGGLRDGHRLHADRRVAADRHFADVNLAGLATRILRQCCGLCHRGG
jgi:hypothetical protein